MVRVVETLLEGEELSSDDARQPHPGEEPQKEDHGQHRAALDREENEQDEDGGKGEDDVDESHQRRVEPTAVVARQRTDDDADRRRDECRTDADDE